MNSQSASERKYVPPCSLVEPYVYQYLPDNDRAISYPPPTLPARDCDLDAIEAAPSLALVQHQKRSIVLGILVGFVIESLSLAWHVAIVQELDATTTGAGHKPTPSSTSAPIVVALLLWTLVTVTAPFVALAYLVGFLRKPSSQQMASCYDTCSDEGEATAPPAVAIATIERWFGIGAVIGVCWSSVSLDAALGFNTDHVRFSFWMAAATACCCLAASRVYRQVLWQAPAIMAAAAALNGKHRKSSTLYDAVDPEQMDAVELAPGSLKL